MSNRKQKKKRVANENYSQQQKKINKIIVVKKKKKKKAPVSYAERAEWLRDWAGQDLGFKNKKKFTAKQKTKITRLFAGKKQTITKTRIVAGKKKKIKQTVHTGGLYQWRDSHRAKIKSDKQRAALERQHVKIEGDVAFIPRRQKGEKVSVNSDGSRTRYIGEFRQKTHPLTHEQIIDMLDDPEGAAEWIEEIIGPGEKYRIEYRNGFGMESDSLPALLDLVAKFRAYAGPKFQEVTNNIIGIMVTTRVLRDGKKKGSKGKKSKTGKKGRGS